MGGWGIGNGKGKGSIGMLIASWEYWLILHIPITSYHIISYHIISYHIISQICQRYLLQDFCITSNKPLVWLPYLVHRVSLICRRKRNAALCNESEFVHREQIEIIDSMEVQVKQEVHRYANARIPMLHPSTQSDFTPAHPCFLYTLCMELKKKGKLAKRGGKTGQTQGVVPFHNLSCSASPWSRF